MKKMTIYLPDDLAASVKAAAKRVECSQSSLIREAVATHVAALGRPLPRTKGIISDGSFDARDTEDWLLENWRPDW